MNVSAVLEKLNIQGGIEDRNNELWVRCPLPYGNHKHGDKNPSFSINLRTGYYNCFVCGGGGLTKLVAEIKGLSYEEAKAWIEDELYSNEAEESFQQRMLERLNQQDTSDEEIVETYEFSLDNFEEEYIKWLEDEGISEATVKEFNICLDPDLPGVVFPHYWHGKLVGWQKRDLNPPDKRQGPKYKNTPKFPKRNTLFNYDYVRQHFDDVIVLESPKTVCVMHSRGIENCVATFGAEVNYEQMEALWSFQRVYLWFDNDDAGAGAYESAAKSLQNHCEVWAIPPATVAKGDPADISLEECRALMEKATPYLRYKNAKIYNQ